MFDDIPNLPPKHTRKKDMTPEQLEACREYKRRYARQWAKANYEAAYARRKERMATDPEFAERMRKYRNKAKANQRSAGKKYESPEARENRLRLNREYKAKKYREWRLANPIQPKPPKEEKPKQKPVEIEKKKPGRILASLGWR